MAIVIRSSLKPYFREDRGKWYPRGTYPWPLADGTVERRRGFLGAGFDTRTACQKECDRLNSKLEADAAAGPAAPTFEQAALVHMKLGGDGRFITDKLLDQIGHLRCDGIDDAVLANVAATIYPNAKPQTLNRQLFTPVIAVLRRAAKKQKWKPELTRPKGATKLRPAKSPDDSWFDAVRPHMVPQLWAFVLFCTLHGRRPSDAFRLLPEDFDPVRGTVLIEKDKNGDPVFVRLAAPVLAAIQSYDWKRGPGLFKNYTWANRRRAYKALHMACEAAGVPFYGFHKAGRHAFAKRLLSQGHSLAHVKASGRWETFRVVGELYGAYEHSEVDEMTRKTSELWAKRFPKPPKPEAA